MHGINLAEQCHIVNALPPINITGGKFTDVWSMKKHSHVSIIIQIGVSSAAFLAVILNACDNFTPSNRTALAFSVYKEETAAGDTLGARTAVASAGMTPSANDNVMYVIEFDADDLPDGFDYMEVSLTNGTNSVIGSVVAILSGQRYAGTENATAIA